MFESCIIFIYLGTIYIYITISVLRPNHFYYILAIVITEVSLFNHNNVLLMPAYDRLLQFLGMISVIFSKTKIKSKW